MRTRITLLLTAAAAICITSCTPEDDSGLIPPPELSQNQSSPYPAPVEETEPTGPKPQDPKPQESLTPPPPQPTTLQTTPTPQKRPPRPARDYFPVQRCVNMGNALEAPVEGEWGYRIDANHFRIIRDGGFDTVRIPIRWSSHTQKVPPYKIDPAFMKRVETVVNQALDVGLGVIIDVHHYEALMENVHHETPRFLAMWEQIGSRFQNAPSNVYFEPINEPVAPMTMAETNQLYAQVLPVIRKTNPTRAVILGGDDWNYYDRLDTIIFPNDPYLVATFHDYGPYKFTHQGASWIEGAPPLGRKWGRKSDLKDLSDTYETARNFQKRTGLPVFVGEFGVLNTIPAAERSQWMEIRRRAMEETGMSWCAWDFAAAFNTYDLQRGDWVPGMLTALMGP